MRHEIPYYNIGSHLGGWQEWFPDKWMRLGGCGAVTACDASIVLDKYFGTHLYPYDKNNVSRQDFLNFGMIMKPYLRPRWTGIDKLDIYVDGFNEYLKAKGETDITLTAWAGTNSLKETKEIVKKQIDAGFPIPTLTLKHKAFIMNPYTWHWYILAGYEEFEDTMMVKLVTYGTYIWIDLSTLWTTGYRRKGGLILIHKK